MKDGQWRVDAVLDRVEVGQTDAGNDQIAFMFRTTEGEQLTAYRYFTDRALQYTEDDLKTLGWDPVEHNWNLEGLVERQQIAGAEVSLVLENDTYEGKTKTVVRFINKRGGGVKNKLDKSGLQALAARLRSTSGSSTPKPIKVDDEDIPF